MNTIQIISGGGYVILALAITWFVGCFANKQIRIILLQGQIMQDNENRVSAVIASIHKLVFLVYSLFSLGIIILRLNDYKYRNMSNGVEAFRFFTESIGTTLLLLGIFYLILLIFVNRLKKLI